MPADLRWDHAVIAMLLITIWQAFGPDHRTGAQPPAEPPVDVQRPIWPGLQPSGATLLPTGWSLKPAGTQLTVGDFPVHVATHPNGRWAAVMHSGYRDHEIVVVNTAAVEVVSRVVLPQTFYGLAFNPAGDRLYASGAEDEVVYQFDFSQGYLSDRRTIEVAPTSDTFVPTGIHITSDGESLLVCGGWGHQLKVISLADHQATWCVTFEDGSHPYTVMADANSNRAWVSLWGGKSVAVVDLKNRCLLATWPIGSHPTEMVLTPDGRLCVACSDTNHVYIVDAQQGNQLEVLSTALYPESQHGSTPNSLALSPDGKLLAIANADNNNLVLFDLSDHGNARSLGFIPVGWYPTNVRFSRDGNQLLVANGKGLTSHSNRHGPKPGLPTPHGIPEYIGRLFTGTVSVIAVPGPAETSRWNRIAYRCSPLQAGSPAQVSAAREANHPIPAVVGDTSPIKYCIYIVKENRTYDQVFGDLPQGNGDPSLCLFPRNVTPNHHALAEQFVLLDNFYVESEVSADGHEWSMAAYATDFVEKTWPLTYRGGRGKLTYPAEGSFEIAQPSSGYIWDQCRRAGVSYYSFGEFVRHGKKSGEPSQAAVPSLEGHFDPEFRSYDLDYTDQRRADRYLEKLKEFDANDSMPRLTILRLPNDHTYGTRVGKPTPRAMVADNDLALGRIVEAVSHSRFWPQTAIFVVQDDAQNGSDHVDAHRTVALCVSPFTRRGYVDSSMYSTASMLRTMELILGLEPMTQFDAAARPMDNSFTPQRNLQPYVHLPTQIDLDERNQADAWGADLSAKLDLSSEDAADDLLFGEIVWRSVKGSDSPMPAPVRAAFVHPVGEEDD